MRKVMTARQRLRPFGNVSRLQTEEETYDLERTVVGSVLAGVTADRCGQCGACDRAVVPVDVGDREDDYMAVKDKPHGPVSEHFMRHYYGASKPAPTPHPDSHGHWDHAQISDLLHERDRLQESRNKVVRESAAQIKALQDLKAADFETMNRLRAELAKHQESEFHPDWSMLEATRASLREHMEIIRGLRAELAATRELLRELRKVVHSSYAQKIDAALGGEKS